jgi:hypoxanthine phosphoribosyltransferase
MQPDEAWKVLDEAELICDADAVRKALERVALEISEKLGKANPLVLVVMRGGILFAGQLLPLLRFPLDLDYVHATRYNDSTSGGKLEWRIHPPESVKGRAVLVLDDILDAGDTLAAIRERLNAMGAQSCHVAVLSEKKSGRAKKSFADFVGVELPDRYVFGCGLDVAGAWRNLPEIYALKNS